MSERAPRTRKLASLGLMALTFACAGGAIGEGGAGLLEGASASTAEDNGLLEDAATLRSNSSVDFERAEYFGLGFVIFGLAWAGAEYRKVPRRTEVPH